MIPVTKPFLPPKEEYDEYVDGIWKRNWLTNNGPLVNELELRLKEHLKLKHMLYMSNGTIAIQIAIKALGLQGEIITTPFSYVATSSSIVWEGCKPVFVDIDSNTLNIDPTKIEAAITSSTSAILATHVYGNPCDVDAIQQIATKHGLKVIYDAAHAFGVTYKGQSIFSFGDVVTTSFHATKLYHTIEGGAVFTNDSALLKTMAYMRNFGHNGPYEFFGLGINGKNSEFHAAMGLVNLNHIQSILKQRKKLSEHYDEKLKKFRAVKPRLYPDIVYNYSYYPLVFESEELLLKVLDQFTLKEIFARRYFYPSLGTLPYVDKFDLPVASDICKRVVCLPLFHDLSKEEIDLITRLMLRVQNNP